MNGIIVAVVESSAGVVIAKCMEQNGILFQNIIFTGAFGKYAFVEANQPFFNAKIVIDKSNLCCENIRLLYIFDNIFNLPSFRLFKKLEKITKKIIIVNHYFCEDRFYINKNPKSITLAVKTKIKELIFGCKIRFFEMDNMESGYRVELAADNVMFSPIACVPIIPVRPGFLFLVPHHEKKHTLPGFFRSIQAVQGDIIIKFHPRSDLKYDREVRESLSCNFGNFIELPKFIPLHFFDLEKVSVNSLTSSFKL